MSAATRTRTIVTRNKGNMSTHEEAIAGPYVGGEWIREGLPTLISENPAQPSAPLGNYATADESVASAAVRAAHESFGGWRRRSALERGQIIRAAAELLTRDAEEFASLITREEGKPLPEARSEVQRTVETLHYHASAAWWPSGETFNGPIPEDLIRTIRVPVGVVAVITPWNFPLLIPAWKIAPALLHGNTVVWKPATPTSLTAVRFTRLLAEAGVSSGALNLVPGNGQVGEMLVTDGRVDAITFTGSEAVGRRIAGLAVARNAKFQLELGGHNPAVVLADADLERAVPALITSVTSGSGQKCTAARRIIAQAEIYDKLAEQLEAGFGRLAVGNGMDAGIDVGPLVTAQARDDVTADVDRALEEGCELIARTPLSSGPGNYFAPTLLSAADQSPTICREEVFGPVTVLLRAPDADGALALAADTRYGLTAAVFTGSEAMARRAAEEIPVGILNINGSTTGSELHVPFGGMKASSTPGPREQGMTSRDFYTETRAVYASMSR